MKIIYQIFRTVGLDKLKNTKITYEGSQIGIVTDVNSETGEITGTIFDDSKGFIQKIINQNSVISMGSIQTDNFNDNITFNKDE